jgi:hypothetical protein
MCGCADSLDVGVPRLTVARLDGIGGDAISTTGHCRIKIKKPAERSPDDGSGVDKDLSSSTNSQQSGSRRIRRINMVVRRDSLGSPVSRKFDNGALARRVNFLRSTKSRINTDAQRRETDPLPSTLTQEHPWNCAKIVLK